MPFKSVVVGAARVLPDFIYSIFALAAVASIAYGAWLVFAPAGYIVAGVLTLAALWLHVVGSKSQSLGG